MSRVRGHKRISRIVSLLSILGLLIPYFAVSTPTKAADDAAPEVFFSGASFPAKYGPLNIPVSANDPDGDFITSWTYSISPQPIGETQLSIRHAPANDLAVLTWTPVRDDLFNQDGSLKSYEATFCAYNALSGCATNEITFYLVPNTGPTLDPIGDKAGFVGVNLAFDVTASDEQGDPINFTATASPDIFSSPYTAILSSANGHFDWTPDINSPPVTYITFCAIDNNPTGDLSDCENITITVVGVNLPPILDPIVPSNITVYHNDLVDITVHGTDPNGDAVVYTARPYQGTIDDPALTWLGRGFTTDEFDTHTGQLTWTPGPNRDFLGTHQILFCIYSTPDLHDCKILTVTILNRTPQIDAFSPASIDLNHNDMLDVMASGSDEDEDTYTFTARPFPNDWLGRPFTAEEFDQNTGRLRWTPGPNRDLLGERMIHFCMYDYEGTVLTCTDLTVNILNRRPQIDTIAPQTVYRGDLLTFTVTGSDEDGDTISFTDVRGPGLANADFDRSTGIFTWQTSLTEPLGERSVHFCVYDYQGTVLTCTDITITVENHPPVARFTAGPLCYSIPVRFNGTASFDPDGSIATSSWDFGDSSPILTGSLDTYHAFSGTGPYTSKLSLVDNEGATGLTEQTLTIGALTVLQGSPIPGGSKERYQLGDTYGFSLDFLPPSGTTLDKLDLTTENIWLQSNATGSVAQIQPTQMQNVWGVFGTATFSPGDLDALFANIFPTTDPKGTEKNLPITLLVPLKSGGCQYVQVQFTVTVKKK